MIRTAPAGLRGLARWCLAPLVLSVPGTVMAEPLHTLHNFYGRDGAFPNAGLIFDAGPDRALYGTTESSKGRGDGTIFSINPVTGTETTLHRFFGGTDGRVPQAGLTVLNGTMYGVTSSGGGAGCGGAGCGTLFGFTPGGKEHVLYRFAGSADGAFPNGQLLAENGLLYGTTVSGGIANEGTVFQFDPQSRVETVLYHFNTSNTGSDGANPHGMLAYVGGALYGTTTAGGPANGGSVFKLTLPNGVRSLLHFFSGGTGDGNSPASGLLYLNGLLYGTVPYGGGNGWGAVYVVDPSTGSESLIYNFKGGVADGGNPFAGLVATAEGKLWGTTAGANSNGQAAALATIFKLDPVTGTETIVHNFGARISGTVGNPSTSEVLFHKGQLFGTTFSGGDGSCFVAEGCGSVFRLSWQQAADSPP